MEDLQRSIKQKDAVIRRLERVERSYKDLVYRIQAWRTAVSNHKIPYSLESSDWRMVFEPNYQTRTRGEPIISKLYLRHAVVRYLVEFVRDDIVPILEVSKYIEEATGDPWDVVRDRPYMHHVICVDDDGDVSLTEPARNLLLRIRERACADASDDEDDEGMYATEFMKDCGQALMDTVEDWWQTAGVFTKPDRRSRPARAPPTDPAEQERVLRACFARGKNTVVPLLIRFLGPGERTEAETAEHMLARPAASEDKTPQFNLTHYTQWGAKGRYGVVEKFSDTKGQKFLRLTAVAQRVYDSL